MRRLQCLSSHISIEKTSSSHTSSCNCSYGGDCPVDGRRTQHNPQMMKRLYPLLRDLDRPLRVLVTGAAGNISYSLLFMISNGQMFGPCVPIVLHMLDIPPMAESLKGVEMELLDGAYPLLKGIVSTVDVKTAFMGVDVAILVGSFPRQKGMERKDLLKKNVAIFKEQGKALNDFASRNVKVLVVGNPANTNCLIAMHYAKDLPKSNFTALTRLDHNRAKAQLAQRMAIPVNAVHNAVIWGNHSSTQYPDASYAYVSNYPNVGFQANVRSIINDDAWLRNEFISIVQQRGAEIIKARKLSSAASASNAIVDHLRDWLLGTAEGEMVSMAVCSDGSYGIPEGLICSFPVTCSGGRWQIVKGLTIDQFSRQKIDITVKELQEEKQEALSLLSA